MFILKKDSCKICVVSIFNLIHRLIIYKLINRLTNLISNKFINRFSLMGVSV